MGDLSVIKKVIIATINLYPNGILQNDLKNEYRKLEGQDIPFGSFGYASLKAFLENELQNNVEIVELNSYKMKLYPIANATSGHVAKFVQGQDKKHKTGRRNCAPNRDNYVQQERTKPSANSGQSRERSPTMPPLVPYNRSVYRNAKMQKNMLEQSQMVFLARKREQATADGANKVSQRSNQTNDSFSNGENSNGQLQTSIQTANSSSIKMILRNLELQVQSKKGSKSQKTQPQADQSASKPVTVASKGAQITSQEQSFNNAKSAKTSSLWCSQPSSKDLESYWDDDLDKMNPNLKNENSVYGVSDIRSNDNSNHDSVKSQSSHDILRQTMAETTLSDDTKQNTIKEMIDELHVGDYLPVRVTNLNNPQKFWIQIRLKKYIERTNVMFKRMQEFYKFNYKAEELKVYNADDPDAKYFVTHYSGFWRRVEPIDTPMGEAVQVSFIDHGERLIINTSKMRHLIDEFHETPKLAVCCALGNIRPIGSAFSTASADVFTDMVDGKDLFARILRIDPIKSKAIIELIDNKKVINDELIRLGYAIAKTERAQA